MKRLTLLLAAMGMLAVPGYTADDDRRGVRSERSETRRDIDSLIRDINDLSDRPGGMRTGMSEVSRLTGVPLRTIEREHQQHERLGLGGLYLAHEFAKTTGKPVDQFIKTRLSGKKWVEIATANNQSLPELERKLTSLYTAMINPGGQRADRDREDGGDTTTRTGETHFQETIKEVNALGQNPQAEREGLLAIARATDLPLRRIEQAHQQHQNLGLGDLFVAQQLALKSNRSIDELWRMHVDGKRTWADIARDFNVDTRDLARQLTRVETAMRDPNGRTPVRERDRGQRDRDDYWDDRDDDRGGAFSMDRFQRNIQQVNALGENHAVKRAGLAALSKETAVPLPRIEQMSERHQNLGVGDLFVAQQLALKSNKSVDELWRMHVDGKRTWADIAREYNVDVRELHQKLTRIQNEMLAARTQ
jgi:hypothetical protein